MIRKIVGLLGMMMALCAWAAPARAADQVEAKIISIGIGGSSKAPWGEYREGSWLPIKVSLKNGTGEAFSGKVAIEQNDVDGDRVVVVSREVNIEASIDPTDVWLYCWPRPDDDTQRETPFTVEVMDKNGAIVGKVTVPPPPAVEGGGGPTPSAGTPWIRKREYEYNQAQRFVLVLGPKRIGLAHYLGAAGAVVGTAVKYIESPVQLPDRAIGLDGVDVIVWQMDDVHLSDMPAGFQLKAIQDWVKSGGQLVITAGRSLDIKASNFGAGFLPIEVTGKQDIDAKGFKGLFGMTGDLAFDGVTVSQMTGTAAADAMTMDSTDGKVKGLEYMHNVGVGVVDVITVSMGDLDLANNNVDRIVKADQWLRAWQALMGWSVERDRVRPYAEAQAMRQEQNGPSFNSVPFSLDDQIPGKIDFYNQTTVRMLMAFLFLGLYWVVAGPAGAAVLKYYKVSHWGWWIFGATVLAASGVAMLVVSAFRLERVDLKHQTLVMGTANSTGDVSVVGYYGVFAPVEGQVALALPESAGLAYLALFSAQVDKVEHYADPQQYVMDNASLLALKVPFRSTLKKMEARWTGPLKMEFDVTGLEVTPAVPTGPVTNRHWVAPKISGQIINKTGYKLHDIEVIIPGNLVIGAPGGIPDAIASINELKDGETFELAAADSKMLQLPPNVPGALREYVGATGLRYAREHGSTMAGGRFPADDLAGVSTEAYPVDFLNVFMEYRAAQSFTAADRVEFERQLTRLMDRSKNVRTSRAIVIAHAGSATEGVASPLPMNVAGHEIRGSGEILFTWVVNP